VSPVGSPVACHEYQQRTFRLARRSCSSLRCLSSSSSMATLKGLIPALHNFTKAAGKENGTGEAQGDGGSEDCCWAPPPADAASELFLATRLRPSPCSPPDPGPGGAQEKNHPGRSHETRARVIHRSAKHAKSPPFSSLSREKVSSAGDHGRASVRQPIAAAPRHFSCRRELSLPSSVLRRREILSRSSGRVRNRGPTPSPATRACLVKAVGGKLRTSSSQSASWWRCSNASVPPCTLATQRF
jgi:hypothetical protein